MKLKKHTLHLNEWNALNAIAKSRVPQMLVLYNPIAGGDVMSYINLN